MSSSIKAGKITVNFTAGTAGFESGVKRAGRTLHEFSSHSVSDVQATSAALRVLEGNINNNLRAAENFLAKTLGLGAVLKNIFPIVGSIALLGVVDELAGRVDAVYQGFKRLQEAPGRIVTEFQGLSAPIRVANDELAVSNDRLANEIAKLQGRPQNNLALALDEARAAADKLSDSLQRDLGQVAKLLETETIGSFKGLITNTASTGDVAEQFKKFREDLTGLDVRRNDLLLAAQNDPIKQAELYKAGSREKQQAIDAETAKLNQHLAAAEALIALREKAIQHPSPVVNVISGVPIRADASPIGADQGARISTLKGAIDTLQQLSLGIAASQTNAALTSTRDKLLGDRQNADAVAPTTKRLADLRLEHANLTNQLQSAAGTLDPVAEAMAKGAADASKAIAELTQEHQKLSQAQRSDIEALSLSNALIGVQITARDKQAQTMREIAAETQDLDSKLTLEAQQRDQKLSSINDQIDAARALAKAEGDGADAAYAAQEKVKLARILDPAERSATKYLDDTEHDAQIAKSVADLDRQTASIQRNTAALHQGTDARRQAVLADIAASGASKDVIAAETRKAQAQFGQEDETTGRGSSASKGFHDFFQGMEDNAKSAGQMVQQTLGSAFEGLNEQMEAIVAGQKTSWGSFFKGLGSQLLGMSLNKMEGTLLGNLFGSGKSGSGGGGLLSSLLGSTTGAAGGAAAGGSASAAGSGFFAKLFGGARAKGGSVDPGKTYLVGENGPELFTPPGGGSITPNNKLGSGSTHYYTIDARGTDPVLTEQRTKAAIIAAHNSAVRTSGQVSAEKVKRTPQK